jgi:hypothetical protein
MRSAEHGEGAVAPNVRPSVAGTQPGRGRMERMREVLTTADGERLTTPELLDRLGRHLPTLVAAQRASA